MTETTETTEGTTTMSTRTTLQVSIAWTGKSFAKAVAYAKRFDGTFNPTTKTWAIKLYPHHTAGLDTQGLKGFLSQYGLALVEAPAEEPSPAANPVRDDNLARFDATVAKALASPGRRPADADFLVAVRTWLAGQTETILPAAAIQTYIAANPGSSPR